MIEIMLTEETTFLRDKKITLEFIVLKQRRA